LSDQPSNAGVLDGAPGPSAAAAPARRPWRRIVGLVLGVGILAALAWLVVSQWQRVPAGALRPNWWLIAAAFAAFPVVGLAIALRWRAVLWALGRHLSAWQAYKINAYAALGLYVPGKVVMIAAKSYLAAREGVPLRVATLSVLYDIALNLISGALFVPLWLAVSGAGVPGQYRWVSAGVAALGFCLLHPALVGRAASVGGRILGRAVKVEGLSYATLLRLVALYLGVLVLQGAALWLFVRAFYNVPLLYVADCTGMLALGLCVGLLLFVVPAGLGVREGVLAGVMSLSMPLPLAAAIALALRVLGTFSEACTLGVVFLASFMTPRGELRRNQAPAATVLGDTSCQD